MQADTEQQPGLSSLRDPALLLATWWGSGLSPWAPGTMGSLAALPFIAVAVIVLSPWLFALVFLLVFFLGVWCSDRAGKAWGKADHGAIVIDEVVGQAITVGVPGYLLAGWVGLPALLVIGFVWFRIFDIFKPWPASWFDRHSKNGWGVMLDDVAAGFWAAFVATATALPLV